MLSDEFSISAWYSCASRCLSSCSCFSAVMSSEMPTRCLTPDADGRTVTMSRSQTMRWSAAIMR